MIQNAYAKKCQSCETMVAVGAGFAYKNGNRWLTVCASSACIARLGLKTPEATSKERKLCEDGRVIMPFDRQALPLLRSMPGARWNPEAKAWFVSMQDEHLPRVLEVAGQLKLEIPACFVERAKEGTPETRAAKERASRQGLYDYQREGVEFLALHKNALLADDMGLGKTIQTLVALPDNAKTIVVVPACVKYNWADETEKWCPKLKAVVLSGRESFRVPNAGEVIIINYDILPSYLAPNKETKEINIPDNIKKELSDVILVVDEASYVKNYKAARSQKVSQLSKLCERTWFLTGTPLMNRPYDLFGVLSSGNMAHKVFGSWDKFIKLFNGHKGQYGGYVFGDPTQEVGERLRRVMLRRLKSEVLKDLPAKTYQTITVNDLGKELSAELDEAWEEYEEEGDLPDFKDFSAIRAKLAAARIPAAIEIVETYEENETPLLVFSYHKKPVIEIGKRDGWASITSETDPLERRNIVRNFQAGKLKGVALTIGAGGVGLTLTRASHVLFVDLDWTPAMNLQAEDRAHRIGQINAVLIMQMVSKHPLDRHVYNLIAKKMRMIELAMQKMQFKPPASINRNPVQIVEETEADMLARIAAIEAAAKEVEKEDAKLRVSGILGRELAKSSVPEPKLTGSRKRLIREALDYMIGRCDGARTLDGIGFSKPDAGIAHWIYATGLEEADEVTYRVTERILSRYYRQLNMFAEIWKPGV